MTDPNRTSNEHNNAPAVPQGEQATIAGLDAASGHLSTLLDDSVLMLKQLRQMVDDLHERWSNGGKPERGEFDLLDRVDDWLSCRPDSMLSPPAPHVLQEPVMWQYRTWFAENTGTPGWSEWAEVKARNAYIGTVMDSVRELQHYIAQGYKYEIRALYAATPAPAPAQEAAMLTLAAEDVHAAFTKNFPKTRISQAWISFAADIAQAIAARAAAPAQEVGLTDEEIDRVVLEAVGFEGYGCQAMNKADMRGVSRAIIAALRAKGGN